MTNDDRSRAALLYQDFLKSEKGQDNKYLNGFLQMLFTEFKDGGDLVRRYANVYAANLGNDITGRSITFESKNGKEKGAYIVMSAPVMLMVFRLGNLFMQHFDLLGKVSKKMRVIYTQPNGPMLDEFHQIKLDYFAGLTMPMSADKIISNRELIHPEIRSIFSNMIHLAEIWMVLHEVCHVFSSNESQRVIKTFDVIQKQAVEIAEEHDLFPIQEIQWRKEIIADLSSMDLLFNTELSRHGADRNNKDDREQIGSVIVGSIKLAIEVMRMCEEWLIAAGKYRSDRSNHPPTSLRWMAIKKHIKSITATGQGVNLYCLAEMIEIVVPFYKEL